MRRLGIILLSITLFISFNGHSAHHGEAKAHQKAVLVTGSNSGLGLRMTQQLSKNGFYVYAGVLHKDEMKAMNQMVLYSKVVTIRDKQLEENKRLEQEWIEEQKKLDLMMEIERLKVLKEEEHREARKQVARNKGAQVIVD
jgi:NAD(P)-dependent dehydrogenase (short-subunit alcohol dehydrogenase family)